MEATISKDPTLWKAPTWDYNVLFRGEKLWLLYNKLGLEIGPKNGIP